MPARDEHGRFIPGAEAGNSPAKGSGAVVSIDVREVARLAKILNDAALDSTQRRDLMASLGAEIEDQTKERFDTKLDPEGKAWATISEKHRAFLERKYPGAQPPLVMEGFLRSTVENQPSEWDVLIGATRVYAAVHQFGWPEKNIPARPYLGVNPENGEELAAIAVDFLESVLRKAS